jgi:hypothetical protein
MYGCQHSVHAHTAMAQAGSASPGRRSHIQQCTRLPGVASCLQLRAAWGPKRHAVVVGQPSANLSLTNGCTIGSFEVFVYVCVCACARVGVCVGVGRLSRPTVVDSSPGTVSADACCCLLMAEALGGLLLVVSTRLVAWRRHACSCAGEAQASQQAGVGACRHASDFCGSWVHQPGYSIGRGLAGRDIVSSAMCVLLFIL